MSGWHDIIISEEPIMITEKSDKSIVSFGIQSESFFNVKQENLAHIFGILRNQLYSDKILAVVREYCTNAMDANIDAGVPDCPIQVSIPNAFSPVFKVRDFGKGLSEEQVYNIFGSYGESTKRNTNEQTGCLGLGSKSAFSYVDSFLFTSYNGGNKTVYSAYIDETEIGKITRLTVEPSSEPSGIEITVNVKTGDFGTFHDRAYEVLRYFTPKPIIHNDNHLQKRIDNHDLIPILSGENWIITKNQQGGYASRLRVVMGNVVYPVNINNLGLGSMMADYLQSFRYMEILLKAPIGAVKNSASREALEYNQKTISWLFNAVADFKEQVGEVLSEQMNSAKTMWDALLMYNELSNKVGQSNALKFRGKIIHQGYISVNSAKCRKVEKNRNGKLQWEGAVHIKPHSEARIFVDKGNISRHELFGRINAFGDLTTETYLIQFDNPTLADEYLAKPELEGFPFIDLATANYAKPVRKQSVGKSVFSEAYLFKPGQSWRKADNWTPCQIDLANGSGVYVEISHYAVVGNYLEAHHIETFQNLLHSNGIDLPVYGVRSKTAKTLGSGWKTYQQYQVELFNQLTNTHGFSTRWDVRTASIPTILQAFSQPVYDQFVLPTEIQEIADAVKFSENIKWTKEFRLASHIFDTNVTRYKSNLQHKVDAVMSKYPMLSFLQWVATENGAKMVVDYLNLVG
jgi:hypothetical protein